MKTYILKGIAEGLAGVSSVRATCVEDIFKLYPLLEIAKEKIIIKDCMIGGINQCDG